MDYMTFCKTSNHFESSCSWYQISFKEVTFRQQFDKAIFFLRGGLAQNRYVFQLIFFEQTRPRELTNNNQHIPSHRRLSVSRSAWPWKSNSPSVVLTLLTRLAGLGTRGESGSMLGWWLMCMFLVYLKLVFLLESSGFL